MKELLIKYINRECTEEETQKIVEYFKSSNDFSDVPTVEDIQHKLGEFPDMDTASAKRISKAVLQSGEKAQANPFKRKSHFWKYAAAAIFVIGLVSTYYFKDSILKDNDTEISVSENNAIEPGSFKATLTLDDGTEMVLTKENSFKTSNAEKNNETLVYKKGKSKKLVYNYLTIPRGGQFQLALADGTKVWLNSETQLKYPVAFNENEARLVELVYGEAYFDVTSSKENNGTKFIVKNQNQDVEVLGTEFNIKSYSDENLVYTTLVEGSVRVNSETGEQNLQPNQQSVLNLITKNMLVKEVDVYNEVSWKEGIFSFDGKNLGDIMRVLSRWYDVEVVFLDQSIKNEVFAGVIRKNKNLESILLNIKNFGIIKNYKINERKVILE